ncbi:MAG: TetR/AcrR family transcriptional regulator [Gemmatimonadota bacterium]|jgi:TetR/AcrR family transcriptional repressor of cmeABC operon
MAGSNQADAPVAEPGYEPREKGLKRRELFLEAATEAFSRNGYEGTSLQDIVAEAGGSLATLYRMFGNKEGLFQAVIDHKFQSVFGQGDTLKVEGHSTREVLTELGMALLEMMLSEAAVAMHRLMITQANRTSALREGFMEMAPDRAKNALADYFSVEVGAKRLVMEDCETSAVQFIGMVKGDILMRRLLGEELRLSNKQRRALVANAVEIFLNGVAPR